MKRTIIRMKKLNSSQRDIKYIMNEKELRKHLKETYGVYLKTISLGADKYFIAYRYKLNSKLELARATLIFNKLFTSMQKVLEEIENLINERENK